MTKLDVVKWLLVLPLVALLWLWQRRAATPDAPHAVEGALGQARPSSVEHITVYPLLPDRQGRAPRPFQLRTAAQVQATLAALRQLRPIAVDSATLRPLLEATVMVRLARPLADAWHLHSRDVILRLATSAQGPVALRALSPVVYQSAALNRQVQLLRDSLAAQP